MFDTALNAVIIIICGIAVILLIVHDVPAKQTSICDRCKNLYYKRSPREKEYYRYVCKVPFKKPFNIPPEYCAILKKGKIMANTLWHPASELPRERTQPLLLAAKTT